MSPYLFTIVMEVLTCMLKRNIQEDGSFQSHPKCQDLSIVNLCFCDDLMLFCHGDIESTAVLKRSLDEFSKVLGLDLSIPKSTIFFSNVKDDVKAGILKIIPFVEGSLPIKYLVVPLISSRLFKKDCKILVE